MHHFRMGFLNLGTTHVGASSLCVNRYCPGHCSVPKDPWPLTHTSQHHSSLLVTTEEKKIPRSPNPALIPLPGQTHFLQLQLKTPALGESYSIEHVCYQLPHGSSLPKNTQQLCIGLDLRKDIHM